MSKARVFTTGQMQEITGVSYSVIDRWATGGVLSPSVNAGKGESNCRGYSLADAVAMGILALVHKSVRKTATLRRVANYCQRPGSCDQELLFVGEAAIREGSAISAMGILSTHPGPVMVIPIREIRTRIEAAAKNIALPNRGKAKLVAR